METLKSIPHNELKDQLKRGQVKFYFKKVKGELRVALGTLDLSKIPLERHPKGGSLSDTQIAYYDLEKDAWRSFSKSQEVWID